MQYSGAVSLGSAVGSLPPTASSLGLVLVDWDLRYAASDGVLSSLWLVVTFNLTGLWRLVNMAFLLELV